MTGPATPRQDRFPLLLSAAVLLVLVVLSVAAIRSWHDLAAQRAREAAVAAEIARTERDVRRLEERIRRLKEDPLTLERLARYELGLVRPEDLVMVFPPPGSSPPPPPAGPPAAGPPAGPATGGAAAQPPQPDDGDGLPLD